VVGEGEIVFNFSDETLIGLQYRHDRRGSDQAYLLTERRMIWGQKNLLR
jgi:hypothetical protein